MKFLEFDKTIDQFPPEGLDKLPARVLPFLWFFMRQIKTRFFVMIALGIAGGCTSGAMSAFFFGHIVAAFVETKDKTQIWDALAMPLTVYTVLVLILSPLLYNSQGWLNSRTLPHYAGMVRRQLGLYLHQHSYRFFQDDFAGRLSGKVLEMPYAMRQIVNDITGPFVYAGITFITTLGVCFWIGHAFALYTLIYIVTYFINVSFFVPKIRDLSQVASRARSVMRGRFVDTITNVLLVKIFARRVHEDAYFRESVLDTSSAHSAEEAMVTRMFRIQHVLNSLFMFSLVLAAVHAWQNDSVDTAQISMILPMMLNMLTATFWLTEIYTGFFERLGEVEEGMEAIVHPHDVSDKQGAKHLVVRDPVVAFENMTFSYPSRPMFDGFTLTIPRHQRVGFVGPSGAGKSSLMQLLLRLHDVDNGRITIDGQNIADMTQDSVRDAIGFIPQMADMLHRSVRDNIRYGKLDATDDEIIAAAKAAQAHDFVMQLRDAKGNSGYDVMVGERGVKLSGGQRQRIAIARAVLKNAPIIVLDEATSSLDSESERLIQDSLETLMQGRTVLVIAHRLSTIAHLDRLVVMDHGRIVEDGTHAELLAKGGLYARLWALQSGGFLADHG